MNSKNRKIFVASLLGAAVLIHIVLSVDYFKNIKLEDPNTPNTGCFMKALIKTGLTAVAPVYTKQQPSTGDLGKISSQKGPMDGVRICQTPRMMALVYMLVLISSLLYWYLFVMICRTPRFKNRRTFWIFGFIIAALIFICLLWLSNIFHIAILSCSSSCISLG